MNKVVYGEQGMIAQPIRRSYVQGRGWTWVQKWIGPVENAPGLEQQLIAAGYDVNVIEDGPNAIVEGLMGGPDDAGGGPNEQATSRWELTSNYYEKEVWNHPKIAAFQSTVFGSGSDQETLLEQFIKSVEQRTLDHIVESSVTRADYPDFYLARDIALMNTLVIGIEQPVLRVTKTASHRFPRSANVGNVGKIIPANKMDDWENAPEDIVPEIEAPNPPFSFPVRLGYKKSTPQIFQQVRNQWQVEIEFIGGVWPEFLFEAATAPA